ncbi:TPA: hypothetical protein PTV74_003381 [Clostridium botulinum]|nr:hypothetical protein [Clostridium botulinum]HDK7206533.1 hypothetical protein [Clostridium botulinum]HDK7210268.1 hypothetical protein [Clostridium botulinum]HDK7265718.1 hypothetical protein [Clostridium botulinum]HDK7269565.1 hypothetical protein [Clostridium botulinum]
MDIKRYTKIIKTENSENIYIKSNKKEVFRAMNKCKKKYAKAMKELAK